MDENSVHIETIKTKNNFKLEESDFNEDVKIFILVNTKLSSIEKTACVDLKKDLMAVTDFTENEILIYPMEIQDFNKIIEENNDSIIIYVDTYSAENMVIDRIIKNNSLKLSASNPGPRGGIISKVMINPKTADYQGSGTKILALLGSNAVGTQYCIYDFSRNDLGIDPFNYWTGYKPKKITEFSIENVQDRVIEPPKIPILCYFDNDNDELANITEPFLEFSFEHWKELIKSLIRIKYNAIDIHDHLGRSEFFRWPYYKKLRSDYKVNAELVNKVIDYAHERGVMIQVSFYLGWNFKSISDKASKNWFQFKDEWIEVWKYYLKETPIGKCDIFLNRPRDQKWDSKYKGKDNPVDVFNEAFPIMHDILKKHNPNAIIIVDLYSEGMGVYENGFRPEPKEDYIMAWPDNGFGAFNKWPTTLDGYKFGIYMHAGFYLNHVVFDPYPELLSEQMKKAFIEYGMTNYCLVNGQTFRHYLINLEACSEICENFEKFDPDEFYFRWISRYFGKEYADVIIKALKMLHESQINRFGYINIMGYVKGIMLRLKIMKILPFIPHSLGEKIFNKFAKTDNNFPERLKSNVENLANALKLVESIKDEINSNAESEDQKYFFYDHIVLPIKLQFQINKFLELIQNAADAKSGNERKKYLNKALDVILEHTELRYKGDMNQRWKGWYDPRRRRPNGGYPDIKWLYKATGRKNDHKYDDIHIKSW